MALADNDDGVVRIMTQNIYQGTNFTELLAATTPPAFLAAVTLIPNPGSRDSGQRIPESASL
jgi:hypothetical protein